MTRSMLRAIVTATSLVALTACSENSPLEPSVTTAALSSGSSNNTATSNRIEIVLARAATSPYAGAKGKAKYSAKSGERELQSELENIPAGTMVTFAYNGVAFGTVAASALGQARVNVNSKLGQTVPMVTAGGIVTASTAAGVVIVSGAF